MRPSSAALAALLALAGCAQQGLPLGPSVLVPAGRFAGAQGEADVVVRAFAPAPQGERREVGGAVCDVSTILFAAQVTTPARLVFPSFGPQSPTLRVDCRAGDLRGAAEQGVAIVWLRRPGAWPGAWPGVDPLRYPYGGGWGGPWGWDGWSGPGVPVFRYPDVNVALR